MLAADTAIGTDSSYHAVWYLRQVNTPLDESPGRTGIHAGATELAMSLLKYLFIRRGDNITAETALGFSYCRIPIPCLLNLVKASNADFAGEVRNGG